MMTMGEGYLTEIFPFFQEIDEERKKQFKEYFKTLPVWIIESFCVEKIEKGKIFIREGEPVEMVYFICKGIIKATDYRIYGISFDFMLFTKVYAFGGMEIIMRDEKYRTSLQTVTDCTVLKIPRAEFKLWMESDIRALSHEAKLMGEYLLEQSRNVRAFLFLQGTDRLSMLLKNRYEKYAQKGILRLKSDRNELSDYTGLSTKTIIRSVKKLKESGLITEEKNQIIINKAQYIRIKKQLAKILADDE